MMCQKNCASTVQRAIASIKHVEHVVVTFATSDALVWIHRGDEGVDSFAVQDIISEVEDVGYDIELVHSSAEASHEFIAYQSSEPDFILVVSKHHLTVANNNTISSKTASFTSINNIILAVDGVYDVQVDAEKRFCVWGIADPDDVIASLKHGGFPATIYDPNSKVVYKPLSIGEPTGDLSDIAATSTNTSCRTTTTISIASPAITEYLFHVTGNVEILKLYNNTHHGLTISDGRHVLCELCDAYRECGE